MQEAREAGPLRDALRRRAGARLKEALGKLDAADLPPLTEAEIRAEIDAVRRERRSART
jgi:hypothetical protein